MKVIIGSAKTHSKTLNLGNSEPVFQTKTDRLIKKGFDIYVKNFDKKCAIDLYDGLVYKYMKKDLWTKDDYEFVNDNIYILSAMYGILKPLDNIISYRLDFNIAGKSHYKFWEKSVNDFLKNELIVNLASSEFSKLINKNLINIKFVDESFKSPSTMSKMARGKMVNYIVKNRITTIEGIKNFDDGFKFDKSLSDINNIIFKICK